MDEKELKRLVSSVFKDNTLDIKKFNEIDPKVQQNVMMDILKSVYAGKEFEPTSKHVLKCIKLTCNPNDTKMRFPLKLTLEKEDNEIEFYYEKKQNVVLMFIFIGAFICAMIGATYAAIQYRSLLSLNRDIDGDGIADLNIDTNNDKVADINIDINDDDKPEVNINYKGNMKAIFAVDKDGDGKPDFNLMNIDVNNNGTCDINCDTNDDGWPDINLDLDGDGVPDMEIDTTGNGKPDLNFDIDGDMVCDIHCDTDKDLICDKACLDGGLDDGYMKNGSSTTVGDPNIVNRTAELIINYKDIQNVDIDGIFPDDHTYGKTEIPDKIFTIENKSSVPVKFSLKWVVEQNSFISENFKVKVTSDNGGGELDWTTAPTTDKIMLSNIAIGAGVTQTYKISFKLVGLHEEQNYDQNKTFAGYITVVFDQ